MATSKIDELIAALETGLRANGDGAARALELPADSGPPAQPSDGAQSIDTVPGAVSSERVILAALPAGEQAMIGAVGGQPAGTVDSLQAATAGELGRLTAEMQLLRGATSQQTETLQGNTQALVDSLTSKAGISAGGPAVTATKMLSNSLGGMFGISPILSGVLSLFGLGKHENPAPLEEFSLPSAIRQEATLQPDNSYAALTYSENGIPKVEGARPAASPTQINVQVQAMDTRSFLDRSDDIARAVKEAMLHSHPLNDVVVDL